MTIEDRVKFLEEQLLTLQNIFTSRINRSVEVENALMSFAVGKREALTQEECLVFARKLGMSDPSESGWLPMETFPESLKASGDWVLVGAELKHYGDVFDVGYWAAGSRDVPGHLNSNIGPEFWTPIRPLPKLPTS